DFMETHFTTKRFSEFSQRVKALVANTQLSASSKIALRMIEVADLLALDKAPQVPAALTDLDKFISDQGIGFRIVWTFNGTLHFINQEEKFAPHRIWLNQFFRIAQGENLHTVEAIFRTSSSASGGSHRLLFVTCNAASISSAPIPRRRIVPARLIRVSLRWPSGMAPPITELPFARDLCSARNSRRSHSGASAIGASFLQQYRLPLA